jgi:hypothetical protein
MITKARPTVAPPGRRAVGKAPSWRGLRAVLAERLPILLLIRGA